MRLTQYKSCKCHWGCILYRIVTKNANKTIYLHKKAFYMYEFCPAARHTTTSIFQLNFKGKLRKRLPVKANMALATAGAIGGTPGSPIP
ncbi:hypothetical protein DFR42_101259 [Undibacterium pigrum]|uniref:Uncharacterized protein n=1 Tax=Undibacterium pigrum TaxID=401470 RepID=A0A318JDU9_9BURK|nr:hypothetical protein DFR42_101259 [Undibacterium pigrum]